MFVDKSDRAVREDELAIAVTHTFRFQVKLIGFAAQDLRRRNTSELGVLLKLHLFLIELDEELAVIENGLTEFLAQRLVHKFFKASRKVLSVLVSLKLTSTRLEDSRDYAI